MQSPTVTEDTRETTFLLQHLSMALQRGNAVAFRNTMITEWNAIASITHFSYFNIIMPADFVLVGFKKNNNNNSFFRTKGFNTHTHTHNLHYYNKTDTRVCPITAQYKQTENNEIRHGVALQTIHVSNHHIRDTFFTRFWNWNDSLAYFE